MNRDELINALELNGGLFESTAQGMGARAMRFRPAPSKWSTAELLCHLRDEDADDFRARLQHVLVSPKDPLPRTDPEGWVVSRGYAASDPLVALDQFVKGRRDCVNWLRSLEQAPWGNIHVHPKVGPIPAELFLVNWVAHDLIHMRQLTAIRYQHLAASRSESLEYAGTW